MNFDKVFYSVSPLGISKFQFKNIDQITCTFKFSTSCTEDLKDRLLYKNMNKKSQGERRQWAVYYTSIQSFIDVFLFVGFTTLGTFDWLVQ